MKKGIVIKVDGSMSMIDVNLKSLQEAVGGYIEHIYPRTENSQFLSTVLHDSIHIICDEEYRLKHGLADINVLASDLYGDYIMGNIVLVTVADDDFIGFDADRVRLVIKALK